MKKLPLPKRDPKVRELIETTDHKLLAQWAIDCMERFLPIVENKYPKECIPRNAIFILKQWINGDITMWEARKYCWKVLKLARTLENNDKMSCQILRACSHTLATCHVPTHAEGVIIYLLSAIEYQNYDNENVRSLLDKEKEWQINHLLDLRKTFYNTSL